MSALCVKVGDGETVIFDGSFTAGRDTPRHHPDLIVDDQHASSMHAGFTYYPLEGWYVQDMGSTNGTYLNDVTDDGRFTYVNRIYGPVLLRRGDKVRVGRTVLICVPA